MITFIGILVLIAGIAILILSKIESREKIPEWLRSISRFHGYILTQLGSYLLKNSKFIHISGLQKS
jgi:hypothetical protein